MKLIRWILLALALSSPAHAGSMTLLGAGSAGVVARTCTDDTATTNFLARTSGLTNPVKDAYCVMIKALESGSIITGNLSGATGCGSVLDGIYILATSNTTTAALNICGTSYSLITNGTPTSFTAYAGYVGDGSTFYLDTGFVPSTAGGNFALNSATMGVYLPNSDTVSSGLIQIGAAHGTATQSFSYIAAAGTGFAAEVNGATFPGTSGSNSKGAWVVSRAASTGFNAYQNGSSTAFWTQSDTSVALPPVSIYLFGYNNSVTPGLTSPWNGLISAGFFGAALTGTQAAALNNAINTFIATVNPGLNIY